jgi:inhibitor of cysteine peptidase
LGKYVRSVAGVIALAGVCVMYSAGAVSYAEVEKASTAMLLLTLRDNDGTAEVYIGDSVRIKLPENATTGFRWEIDRYDEQLFEVLATEPHYPKDSIGAGGYVSFTFRAKNPGFGEIALKNWRHWEGDSSVTNRFRVRLRIEH